MRTIRYTWSLIGLSLSKSLILYMVATSQLKCSIVANCNDASDEFSNIACSYTYNSNACI